MVFVRRRCPTHSIDSVSNHPGCLCLLLHFHLESDKHGDVDDVHHPGGLCLLLHCHRESDKHGDVDDVHHPGGLWMSQ